MNPQQVMSLFEDTPQRPLPLETKTNQPSEDEWAPIFQIAKREPKPFPAWKTTLVRVLSEHLSRDQDTVINIRKLAEKLGVRRELVYEAMTLLSNKGFIVKGEKLRMMNTYRLGHLPDQNEA